MDEAAFYGVLLSLIFSHVFPSKSINWSCLYLYQGTGLSLELVLGYCALTAHCSECIQLANCNGYVTVCHVTS